MTTASFVSVPEVTVSGSVDRQLGDDLTGLVVEEDVLGMCRCELRLVNTGSPKGFRWFGRDVLDLGTAIAVRVGPRDHDREVFRGAVSALRAEFPEDGRAEVVVLAEDALQKLRLTRRTRSFTDTATADLARTVASDHGLTPQVDLDGPSRAVVTQVNVSDLAFLRRQARRDGGEVWLDGSTLHVARRADRGAGTVRLDYGGALLSFTVCADLADQVTSLAVTGWDVGGKRAIDESADASVLGSELGSDSGGSGLLRTAFGERTETVVATTPLTVGDARAVAEAAYLERARRFVRGTGTTAGTAALRVGTTATLAGIGPLFSGDHVVVRTRHTFDLQRGYRTEFDVERPGIGALS